MNSPLAYELVKARNVELQRVAARRVDRRGPTAPLVLRVPARPTLSPWDTRRRAGWWLVNVGLRLAAPPTQAAR
jgi:hypothetical protein